jgi:Chaperone of endosialidase
MTTRNFLFRSAVLGALTCLGSAAAVAGANPNSYVNGTYVFVSYDATPEDDSVTLTFDGAGNYSGTDVNNTGGVITSSSSSGTYTVTSNGTFTASSGAGLLTGLLSADGNVMVITQITSGEIPAITVGIKQGAVSNLNVASGLLTLVANTTGASNSAVGYSALTGNTTGSNNTAFGASALLSNTAGKGNAAQGVNALYSNSTGIRNLGVGNNALYGNTIGNYNIGLGYEGGYNITTGSNNIEIGTAGSASDNNTIQIGSQGTQTFTTIAGIYGTQITGSAVYVTSTGQLGVQGSSERFKTDIAPMPALSEKLQQLRPVTFHYKTDPKSVRQYGLIAEEVDRVYPELVIRDESGKIQGVHYEELAPMLLSEVQQQRAQLQERQSVIDSQSAKIDALTHQVAELNDLKQQMRAALHRLEAEDLLARR